MDKRSPFALSLIDLPRTEGAARDYHFEFQTPADFGGEMLGVPEGTPLIADLNLQSVSEGVYLQGAVRATAHGRCVRCLTDFVLEMDEQVAELIFYPEKIPPLIEEGDEEAEDFPVIDGDHIDLEPILRDSLVLAMPFTPTCNPDCGGLCSECGQKWDELPEDHHHEVFDPRFAALDELLIAFEGSQNEGPEGADEK
ncbi:MAG: DUF177 domain-containing protein [Arcanobacterium sp.]|nr:DUF177 domain-containing protein [Arcanobacterium sp.]